jgi:hypothetical protein
MNHRNLATEINKPFFAYFLLAFRQKVRRLTGRDPSVFNYLVLPNNCLFPIDGGGSGWG